MSVSCARCGYQNSDGSVFCIRCGGNVGAANTGSFGNAAFSSSASQSQYGYQAQAQQAQHGAVFISAPAQMGTGTTSDQTGPHAFAGYGELIQHYAWSLFGESRHAGNFRSAMLEVLQLRNFQNLKLQTEKLRENGYWPEEREYIIMRRGVATIFIYVAPAGQDLYISRATTVQLSFDPIRIVLFVCLLGYIFFGPPILQGIMSGMTSSVAANPLTAGTLIVPFLILAAIFSLFYVPSVVALISLLIASVKHWFAERDFWVYLRRNYLHDFEIDDVKLLEQTTDEVVNAAGKQVKVDITKLGTPPMGYETKRRVRVF